jgi:adenine/guanine phosphoribosyltransferase-like PRPP-binding protein
MERPEIVPGDLLATWKNCGGYYKCPESADGKLLGPLVGYRGTYKVSNGSKEHFVGKVYYNFAKVEQWHQARAQFAGALHEFVRGRYIDVMMGAPMGGILLAGDLGGICNRRSIFAEKKVTKVATESSREESHLIINRHDLLRGDRVAIVEDVCNNFSTTEELISLVKSVGAYVVAIVCALNRSKFDKYVDRPVVSLLHIPTDQYKQDDPVVAEYVQRGQVVWKPKDEWEKLARVS